MYVWTCGVNLAVEECVQMAKLRSGTDTSLKDTTIPIDETETDDSDDEVYVITGVRYPPTEGEFVCLYVGDDPSEAIRAIAENYDLVSLTCKHA
jgi:hypothetical protein